VTDTINDDTTVYDCSKGRPLQDYCTDGMPPTLPKTYTKDEMKLFTTMVKSNTNSVANVSSLRIVVRLTVTSRNNAG
jgi:hypothetical protein